MVSKTLNTSCTTLCSNQPISLSIKLIFGLLVVGILWVFSQWILVSLKFKATTDWFKIYSADNYQPIIEGSTENVPYSDRISLFNMYCAYPNRDKTNDSTTTIYIFGYYAIFYIQRCNIRYSK